MSVVAYLTYHLFNVDGSGQQPYRQVAQMGMEFDGGHYKRGERYLGYLLGPAALVSTTLGALNTWGAVELNTSEALVWADETAPVNSVNTVTDEFIGAAEIDAEGRITKPEQGTPW